MILSQLCEYKQNSLLFTTNWVIIMLCDSTYFQSTVYKFDKTIHYCKWIPGVILVWLVNS